MVKKKETKVGKHIIKKVKLHIGLVDFISMAIQIKIYSSQYRSRTNSESNLRQRIQMDTDIEEQTNFRHKNRHCNKLFQCMILQLLKCRVTYISINLINEFINWMVVASFVKYKIDKVILAYGRSEMFNLSISEVHELCNTFCLFEN